MDGSMRSFGGVLAEKPTNIVALLGKVRSFARSPSLKLTGFRNTGPHSLRKTELSSSSQIIPASLPTKPVVRSRPSNWYRPLSLGNGSQGESKGWMVKKLGSGTYFLANFYSNHAGHELAVSLNSHG
jgi:hypothetical protein